MKTKPFNLEEAFSGAKVVTRDGREVTQLHQFDTVDKMKLYGVVDSQVYSWADNGKFLLTERTQYDLLIAVETKSVWANVYIGKNGFPYVGEYFGTEEDAKKFSSKMPNYIKTIEITNEP